MGLLRRVGVFLLVVLLIALSVTHTLYRRATTPVSDRFLEARKAEQLAADALALLKETRKKLEEAERRANDMEAQAKAKDVEAARQRVAELVDLGEKAKAENRQSGKPRDNLTICYTLDQRSQCVPPEIQFKTRTKVHLVQPDSPQSGWRFQHLVKMGFHMHPAIEQCESMAESDFVLYLPISTKEPPGAVPTKLVVLDEGDGSGFYGKVKEHDYLLYLKRSWIKKTDGAYTGVGKRYSRNYFPMAYSVSDSYFDAAHTKSGPDRNLDIVCSNRPTERQPTRARVVKWVSDFLETTGREGIAGEVNAGGRKEINKAYFAAMRSAKIVVTCNPSFWEGDFRTFEALASGALVFVDEMYVPHPRPFRHGVHVIVYDNSDQADFDSKLAYYLAHPDEARAIANAGLRHALRYHRAVSRMDFVLRSAHELASSMTRYTHTAKQIAFDVNATTQIPPVVDIADPSMNFPNLPAKKNYGRRKPVDEPLSQAAMKEIIHLNAQRRRRLDMGDPPKKKLKKTSGRR